MARRPTAGCAHNNRMTQAQRRRLPDVDAGRVGGQDAAQLVEQILLPCCSSNQLEFLVGVEMILDGPLGGAGNEHQALRARGRALPSTAYWISGLSTTGSISFGLALVAGRNRVPRPATGNTAVRMADLELPLMQILRRPAGPGLQF